jgi:hypothetical protein
MLLYKHIDIEILGFCITRFLQGFCSVVYMYDQFDSGSFSLTVCCRLRLSI